jgi:hypothetical protein
VGQHSEGGGKCRRTEVADEQHLPEDGSSVARSRSLRREVFPSGHLVALGEIGVLGLTYGRGLHVNTFV